MVRPPEQESPTSDVADWIVMVLLALVLCAAFMTGYIGGQHQVHEFMCLGFAR